MGSIEVAAAMGILVAFAMGILIGVVLVVSFASRREDRLYSLWGEAPDPACRGVRRLVGAGVIGGRPLSDSPGHDQDDMGPGQEPER
jgi:hypothetical protein